MIFTSEETYIIKPDGAIALASSTQIEIPEIEGSYHDYRELRISAAEIVNDVLMFRNADFNENSLP